MIRWDFRRSKEFILRNCSQPGWADNSEIPVLESTIDKAIEIAHEIQSYFYNNNFILKIPYFGQCGDGSIDLSFISFTLGYGILYNYHPEEGASLYGDNKCRNWSNTTKIEIKTFNTLESRTVLGLFAKWCKSKDFNWQIEIEK